MTRSGLIEMWLAAMRNAGMEAQSEMAQLFAVEAASRELAARITAGQDAAPVDGDLETA